MTDNYQSTNIQLHSNSQIVFGIVSLFLFLFFETSSRKRDIDVYILLIQPKTPTLSNGRSSDKTPQLVVAVVVVYDVVVRYAYESVNSYIVAAVANCVDQRLFGEVWG